MDAHTFDSRAAFKVVIGKLVKKQPAVIFSVDKTQKLRHGESGNGRGSDGDLDSSRCPDDVQTGGESRAICFRARGRRPAQGRSEGVPYPYLASGVAAATCRKGLQFNDSVSLQGCLRQRRPSPVPNYDQKHYSVPRRPGLPSPLSLRGRLPRLK